MNKNTERKSSASIWQIAKAVMFAFMGIRKKSDLEHDAATLTPAQVIIGGIIGAIIFVLGVMLVVRLVVS
ncbi:DUF2970 domain-containing protein [Nitrosomonas supralitoralis]|uniref:DUF2970 domain-containing protein n=1 Tax=Nitrosomonas supralitoralis TaxID=2116706 RepID=A0A2P7NZ14_9PROT|nr:DUF2970 domain-containing protein [Nitrosomonas supralitoralis]PSJ18700.1 hypothetical protein C7H79_01390 [Nitrosomonas supralitoralis]